jgi:Reverse transcriptase (RNA-dependent DNA polymerase)
MTLDLDSRRWATAAESDHAVFTRIDDSVPSMIALYVDDITMACKSLDIIQRDKEALSSFYEMTDLGPISWILGMHVTRDIKAGWISLSQSKHNTDVLERFGFNVAHPITTPSLPNERLTKLDTPESDAKLYQSAVGALMYTMLGTRPDLAYTVAALGRHSATPGPQHENALSRVFRYLRHTVDKRLVFQRGSKHGRTLHGYVDADWAGDVNDRKSTSGFVFLLSGGAVSWSSKKQPCVALSTTEAEYIAATHALKEAVWLRCLLAELYVDVSSPTLLYIDSQSAMAVACNPEFHDRTKHIGVRYHFLRQLLTDSEIDFSYVPTIDQVADTLTKGLVRVKLESHALAMGLRDAA